MALNEDQARGIAKELLLNMAESNSLKTIGPASGTYASEASNTKRGQYDAIYLAALYRELVNELQK